MFAERHTRKRFFLAFWLFVLSAISFLDRTNISIAGLQISSEYGLGNQRLGWIFSAFLIGYAGFQVPAGWLASRFGPRLVITLGVVWWGVATALTTLIPPGISQAVLLLIGIRFALGAGEAVIYPAANQFVARWVPVAGTRVHQWADLRWSGRGQRPHPATAGMVHSPSRLALGLLVQRRDRGDRRSGVVVAARDTPEEDPKVSPSELNIIRQGITADAAVKPGEPAGSAPVVISWRAILSRRDLPALIISYFGFGYTAWIFFSWFFLYMAQVRGFNLKASALFSMLAVSVDDDRLPGRGSYQ